MFDLVKEGLEVGDVVAECARDRLEVQFDPDSLAGGLRVNAPAGSEDVDDPEAPA
jgi:hypothetical protein